MIDVLELIRRLQREREEKHIVPSHVEFAHLMNEASKAIRQELNGLYQAGKIGIRETINGKAVFVKDINKQQQ